MVLFGAALFVGKLAPSRLAARLRQPIRRLAVGAAIIALGSCVAWLMLEAGEMGEGWRDTIDVEVIASVLGDTAFGSVWIGRLALGFAVIVLLMKLPGQWTVTAVLSCLLLGSLGLVDQAAMHEGALGVFERANQAAHLLCGGFWLGSLAPLLICLPLLGDSAVKSDAGLSLRRFSGLGHVAVAEVVLTGVVNTRQAPC